jgi:hypothetical protein
MKQTWLVAMASAALLLASCATAGGDDDDDDDDDIIVQADADPNQPDSVPVGGDIDAGGGMCPTDPCDLVQQCGCTSPQVCDLSLSMLGSTTCRGVTTPGMEGSACTALEDCAGGYVCVSGSCSKYCAIDVDCGDIRRKCIVTLESGGTPIPGAVTCTSACNPANAAEGGFCPAGFSCHLSFLDPDMDPMSGDETAFATCGAAGAVAQGGACTANTDCAQNHLCVNTGTTTCVRMCTVSPAGGECPIGTTCGGLIPTMLIGGIEYGACL